MRQTRGYHSDSTGLEKIKNLTTVEGNAWATAAPASRLPNYIAHLICKCQDHSWERGCITPVVYGGREGGMCSAMRME